MKIDMHTHILPDEWPHLDGIDLHIRPLPEQEGEFTHIMEWSDGRLFRKVAPNCFCCNTRLNECDGHGVNVQVLSTVPVMFNYHLKPEHAIPWARYINDDLSKKVKQNPRRLVGLGTLPMQDTEAAVEELRRCVTELGLDGIEIGSHINAYDPETGNSTNLMLSDEKLFPIFEAAAELGASVFVHPWDMDWCDAKYWLPWLVGMPAETSLAICSMMLGGVLERLPTLKVMFAHGGGAFPGTISRVGWGFKCRPDLVAKDTSLSPHEQVRSIYLDSLTHDTKVLDSMIEMFGADRIALGSDYPFPLGEMPSVAPVTGEDLTAFPGEMVETSKLDPEVKAQILYKTALEFLGREENEFDWDISCASQEAANVSLSAVDP